MYMTTAESPLGRIVVGWTPVGLSFVGFSDMPELLPRSDPCDVPDIHEATRKLGHVYVRKVLEIVEHPTDLPRPLIRLDAAGTPFQRSVWNELLEVPVGERVSYKVLARRLGNDASCRAVAQACGRNPLAIVVPCHRAVGVRSLGGYRWGVGRKIALLRREECLVGAQT